MKHKGRSVYYSNHTEVRIHTIIQNVKTGEFIILQACEYETVNQQVKIRSKHTNESGKHRTTRALLTFWYDTRIHERG